jgi:hypothetical protein
MYCLIVCSSTAPTVAQKVSSRPQVLPPIPLPQPVPGMESPLGSHRNPGWLKCFEDDRHPIGFPRALNTAGQSHHAARPLALRPPERPISRTDSSPVPELIGNLCQHLRGHPLSFAVGIEKVEHTLWLLDQSVEQDSIKTSVAELDAILVMLAEGVHSVLLRSNANRRILQG